MVQTARKIVTRSGLASLPKFISPLSHRHRPPTGHDDGGAYCERLGVSARYDPERTWPWASELGSR
jgi:hypothetical protein